MTVVRYAKDGATAEDIIEQVNDMQRVCRNSGGAEPRTARVGVSVAQTLDADPNTADASSLFIRTGLTFDVANTEPANRIEVS